MYGAIYGDLAGSIYEYSQIKEIKSIKTNELILPNSFYSDDTILTIAILDAIKNNKDYDKYLRDYNEYSVTEESSITASDSKRYKTKIYNLDAIIE